MKYYNIHTHEQSTNVDEISIVNRNVGEFSTFCGLNIQSVFYSLGIHPWKIREENLSRSIDYILNNAIFDSIKAIGECGLDKLCDTPWELQEKAFFAQIKISEALEKPLIIHCVKAFDELLAFKHEAQAKQAWVIHGFRGKPEQAKQLVQNGFYLSLGLKYNADSLLVIPSDKLFLETDDSDNTIETVYKNISEDLKTSLENLKKQIHINAALVFKI